MDLGLLLRAPGRRDSCRSGLAGIDLVLNPVQSRHEQSGKSQVGIAGGIRATEFQPLGRRAVRVHRDADGGAPVALRIDQVHRRLKTRHQPPVTVGARSGKGKKRRGMLQQPADIISGHLAQPGITPLIVKDVRALLPD